MSKETSLLSSEEALKEVETLRTNKYRELSDETLIELYVRHMHSLNHTELSTQESVQHQRVQLEIEKILISRNNEFKHPEDVSAAAYKMLYPEGDPNKPASDFQPVEVCSGPTFNYL